MKYFPIAALLLLAPAVLADSQEDLEFARRLGAKGFEEMALQILEEMEKSSDAATARAGRFGKAVLQSQQASLKRLRFLRDIEEGIPPRVTREEVLASFGDAHPKIEDYVKNRPDDLDARFVLGEMLQEWAEFLVGADYPETLEAQREQLATQNGAEAEKHFQAAIAQYGEVAKRMEQALESKEFDPTDPQFVRLASAQYKSANAVMRLALLYPKGPKFNYHSEEAIENLDEFLNEHFEEVIGAYAMLDLGRINVARALRQGDLDAAETGINYFHTLYTTVAENPAVPETSDLIAQALHEYAMACNAIARGDQALGKPRPVYFENTIRSLADLRERLKQGAKNPHALRALLDVAEAYAAQNRLSDAVALAGEALASSRVGGHRQIGKEATDRLTGWVARVEGTSVLDAGLLHQIGDSLAGEGRLASAITFYEKAIAASQTEEERDRWAYPAMVRIAKEYQKDRRYFAAAEVASRVVADYLKAGVGEETAFGQVASEACNTARLSWKSIAESTKRAQDESEYQRVLGLFRDKFPGHPENSDAAFATARELYGRERYEEAAKQLGDISPSSRNYWLAQRMVPACYRNLAVAEKDAAKAREWNEKTLAAAGKLVQLASPKGDDPQAVAARQQGELFAAIALAALERWAEALPAIDAYLARYPGELLQRGAEYVVKIDSHLALGQLAEAETALAAMLGRAPAGSLTRRATWSVFKALRDKAVAAGPGAERVALSGRAAVLLESWLGQQKEPDWTLRYLFGQVLFDAQRFGEAAAAFESAAEIAADADKKQQITLLAAESKYRELQGSTDLTPAQKLEVLAKVRDLYTDVLVPPDPKDEKKEGQRKLLEELAGANWPKRETFDKVKRNPRALYVAAGIYNESSPTGIDGRTLALRLIHHLHEFTLPTPDPAKPNLDEFIPTYWDAVELKLNIYLAIAQSGTGAREKQAAADGLGYAKKMIFQYSKMDGPERVNAVKALEAKLKALAPR